MLHNTLHSALKLLTKERYPFSAKREIYRRLYLLYPVLQNQFLSEFEKVEAEEFLDYLRERCKLEDLYFLDLVYKVSIDEQDAHPFLQNHLEEWNNLVSYIVYGNEEEELKVDSSLLQKAREVSLDFVRMEMEKGLSFSM